jgi:hypothetical protein
MKSSVKSSFRRKGSNLYYKIINWIINDEVLLVNFRIGTAKSNLYLKDNN